MSSVIAARPVMPPEWAPHAAYWTAWPYLDDEWAEGVVGPRVELAAMIAAIVDNGRGEPVHLLIRPQDEAAARAQLGAAANHVVFEHTPYGDVWLRDTGPIFLHSPGELVAAKFQWNGWGDKYKMPHDDGVASAVASRAGVHSAQFDFVLEGGGIEVDGTGTLLTTRHCLLDGARNPGLDQRAMEARLRWALGVQEIVWLRRGLLNDHTDSHIDTLARFVAPGVVVCMEPSAGDPNAEVLRELLTDLRAARPGGRAFEVFTVPSPGAVLDRTGAVMPASYMNFVITNTSVIVPTYGTAADDAATRALAALFATRRTVPLSCRAVLIGGGGFHCTTQQQPKSPALPGPNQETP